LIPLLLTLLAIPDTLQLTLEQTLARAYSNAPQIRLAGVDVEQSEIEQKKALSEFFPKLTGQAQVMRLDEAPRIETEFSGIPIELTLGDENIEMLQYGIQLPLWTFGRRLEGYALAGEATQLARLDSCQIST
jgi:outer membrane protein TolC